MKFTSMMSASVAALAVSVLAAGPAGAAAGDSMTIRSAGLVANGAGVRISVTVSCAPYDDALHPGSMIYEGIAQVTITQAVKKGQITSGYAETAVVCDATPHTTSVLIVATSKAFQRGPALVSGQVSNVYLSWPVLAKTPPTTVNVKRHLR